MIEPLKKIVGFEHVLHGGTEKNRFSHIWATDIPLATKGVVFPQTTEQVSEVLKLFNAHQEEVVIHGGLTNLVGGTQTTSNQWVLSLEKMNKIEEVDKKAKKNFDYPLKIPCIKDSCSSARSLSTKIRPLCSSVMIFLRDAISICT